MLLITATIYGQETRTISKEEVINQTELNNSTIKISGFNLNSVKGEYNQTKAFFLPTVGVSYTGISTTNPLMAFGSKLNQGNLTQNDFNPDLLNNPERVGNFSTRVEVSQPLFNLDGQYQRKAIRAKLSATSVQTNLIRDKTVLEVEQGYMQLQLAYKTVQVLKTLESTASENLRLAENNLEQGYVQRADVMLVKIRVAETHNQLLQASSNIANVSNYLSIVMGDSSNVILVPSDSLIMENAKVFIQTLSMNRADVLAVNYAKEVNEHMYKSSKMSYIPRLNAFGSYELNDNDFLGSDRDGYLVGAKLSWNLFEGNKRIGLIQTRKAEFEKSKVEYNQYVAQSELELNKAKRAFEDSKRNIETANLIVEQSKEALRIRTDKFEQGLEKTVDLLHAATQYGQAQLNQANAIFNYNVLLKYLEFLTKEK